MILRVLERMQLIAGVACLSIFFVAILIQVFSRYLGISVIWSEEVANYSFIWSVFMGASIMLYKREHFKFTMLSDRLQGKKKIYLDLFNNIILLIFNLLIFYYGIQTVENFWNYTWISLPLKMGYVWLCIPVMGFTMSVYTIAHLLNNIKELRAKGQCTL
jgi:TRAP-type C4-dicarboxylate transport system permease small subunit